MTEQSIGACLLRKEDDRYMRGRGQYVIAAGRTLIIGERAEPTVWLEERNVSY